MVWKATYEAVNLAPALPARLGKFSREMNVLVLAGAGCGDCAGQCPIFDRFASAAPSIKVRYLDNADHADVQTALSINGGKRVLAGQWPSTEPAMFDPTGTMIWYTGYPPDDKPPDYPGAHCPPTGG